MSLMPWSDSMSLGIESIDNQHRWLVGAVNTLHDELSGSEPPRREVVGKILEGLVDYSVNHFILEEELFQRFGYPETIAHKAEHDGFSAKAMELLFRFEDGDTVSLETLEFVKDWLMHHILKVDKAYAPFLRSKGVV
jgi:hemerythrin